MKRLIIGIFLLIVTIFFTSCTKYRYDNNCIIGYHVYYVDWGNGMGMQPVFNPIGCIKQK